MNEEGYMSYDIGEEVRNAHTGEFGYVKETDESEGKYLVDFKGYEEWLGEDELS